MQNQNNFGPMDDFPLPPPQQNQCRAVSVRDPMSMREGIVMLAPGAGIPKRDTPFSELQAGKNGVLEAPSDWP
ncbi:hypothetical protein ACSYAD_31480 [Acaryochloris marina NIES-2412]|uniref:hypothetical protein n=1 Tax=Acaryochloris marina TaxID=155978 RepID=UPI004058A478